MLYLGQRQRCDLVSGFASVDGEWRWNKRPRSRLGLPAFAEAMAGLPAEASAKASFTKNDDFCILEFVNYINSVRLFDEDFCSPVFTRLKTAFVENQRLSLEK